MAAPVELPPPPPEAAAACWLYILKRARRVISRAERGFPDGLPTPPGIGGLLGGFPRRPSERGKEGEMLLAFSLSLASASASPEKRKGGRQSFPLIEAGERADAMFGD